MVLYYFIMSDASIKRSKGSRLPRGGFEVLVTEIEQARLAYPSIPRVEKDPFFESTIRLGQKMIQNKNIAIAVVRHFSEGFLKYMVDGHDSDNKPQVLILPKLAVPTDREDLLSYRGLTIAVATYTDPSNTPCEVSVAPEDLEQFSLVATMINPLQSCEGIALK